jgi:predicted GNAT family N-acyltransferase
MPDAVVIRAATTDDAEALFDVTWQSAQVLCRDHYPAEAVSTWMGNRTPATYARVIQTESVSVAVVADKVVGSVSAVPGEVTRLFVLPEQAGSGLGRRLMEIGLAIAERGWIGPIHLEATRNAEPFYRRFGFEKVGEGVFSGRGDGFPPIAIVRMERQ